MGKKSVKEDKTPYQLAREDAGLTREAAAEKLYTSPDRLVRIEDSTLPRPEEVVAMAEAYRAPALCNYFCSNQCAIGQKYVPEIRLAHLSQIVLETLLALNTCNREKERLIEIAADGRIAEAELAEFRAIQEDLNALSLTVDTLRLWVDHAVATGELGGD